MKTPDSQTIFMTKPEGLARILSVDDNGVNLWNAEEMQAIWKHQLSAPIDADLDTLVSVRATELRASPEVKAVGSKTFSELLNHPAPPIQLLKLTKEFAKQTLKNAEEAHLRDLASALYYATYAAGLKHFNQLLGSMSGRELLPGFDWALKQSWLDSQTLKLISEARQSVQKQEAK